MQFAHIAGQEAVKQQLIHSVKDGRIPHAQLFLGPEGSGSLPLAVAYAQYISCENRGENDSCGICSSCRKYEKLVHPDLHFSYPFFAKDKADSAITFIQEWRELFLKQPYVGFDDWLSHMDMPTNYRAFPVVEIKFKGSRKDFYINQDNHYLEMGEMVCVDTQTGGYDVGHVSLTGELVKLYVAKRGFDSI